MNLQEFQAKELLARFGIVAPNGRIAASAADAERVARRLGFPRYVVKAQVRAGDRFASGGILFAADPAAVGSAAGRLLGRSLITPQTPLAGELVKLVGIEEAIEPRQLIYVAAMVDPSQGRLVLLCSASGGSEMTDRMLAHPNEVVRRCLALSSIKSDEPYLAASEALGFAGKLSHDVAAVFRQVALATVALDASMIEINPLAITEDGRCIALDAKVTIDDNALFRQPELARLREVEAMESGEPVALGADRHQINYLDMDGDVGVVVNGAGLALATLDMLADHGGRPANFMDIRTTASSQDIAYGFRLIVAKPETRAVLVNVHGGGMQRCDTIAEGLAIALRGTNRALPMVVRFAGNNADFALTRLAASGVAFEAASDMREAAERVVKFCGREVG